jgi:hypothetical protein
MTLSTGAHDISDLLAARFASAVEYGLDTIEKVLRDDIAAHNAIITEMVSDMCSLTTDRQRIYGSSLAGDMVEVDEYGLAPTQKARPGATVAFPLKLFQFNLGWTYKWLQNHTPADMAIQVLGAEAAHLRKIQTEIKRALFASANYTFYDHLVDDVALAVKRLVNADSAPIPNGPNGETFDGASHTHYNASATLTAVALLANITDVVEHGYGGKPLMAISTTDEAAVRLLAGFSAYVDPRIVYRVTDTPAGTLDLARLDNRAIGLFGATEVWVKSWAIPNYAFVWDAASPEKPLAFRQRESAGMQGLRVAAENEDHPLYAKDMEAEFGIGIWARTNGAILYFANVSWADPTIT